MDGRGPSFVLVFTTLNPLKILVRYFVIIFNKKDILRTSLDIVFGHNLK